MAVGTAAAPGAARQGRQPPHHQQQQQQARQEDGCRNGSSRRSGAPDDEQLAGAAIMRQLKAARSWQELQQLVQRHQAELNWRHSSALITHLAQIAGSQPQQQPGQQQQQQPLGDPGLQAFVQTVAPLVDIHLQQYDARGLANSVWALARLRGTGGGASRRWLSRFCEASEPRLGQFDSQQLSMSLWALAKLQHRPPDSWLGAWCTHLGDRWSDGRAAGVQVQALSSALWSLAQLPPGGGPPPQREWVDGLLSAAVGRLQQQAAAGAGAGAGGQALSNLLWACVRLQHKPRAAVLSTVRHLLASVAAAGAPRCQLSDQSLANLLWSLARLRRGAGAGGGAGSGAGSEAQGEEEHDLDRARRDSGMGCTTSSGAGAGGAGTRPRSSGSGSLSSSSSGRLGSSRSSSSGSSSSSESGGFRGAGFDGLLLSCGQLLLNMSERRLGDGGMEWQHASNVVWAAGVLQLRPRGRWVAAMVQTLQRPTAGGAPSDQQVANTLWGLSQLFVGGKAPGPSAAGLLEALSRLLEAQAQQGLLPGYSGQALSGGLLSAARLGLCLPEPALQAWLQEVARRSYMAAAGGQAMADACCALALLRRREELAAATAASRSSSSGARAAGSGLGGNGGVALRGSFQRPFDAEWLEGFCASSASRLGALSGEQLAGVGWALAALRFRPPLLWLVAWQSAVADAAPGLSGQGAARALWALCRLPSPPSGAARGAAAARLAEAATAAAAAGGCDAHTLALTATSVVALSGRRPLGGAGARSAAAGADSGRSRGGRGAPDVPTQPAIGSGLAGAGGRSGGSSPPSLDTPAFLRQLLQALPPLLDGCSGQQLAMLLSAAAAARTPLPPGLMLAALRQAQQLAERRQLGSRGSVTILAAVAKLTGAAAREARGRGRQRQQDGQQEQGQEQQQQQPWVRPSPRWLRAMLARVKLSGASPSELATTLWALAVLDVSPGQQWLDVWVDRSRRHLAAFRPSQLASAGWALVVLGHRPSAAWRGAWAHASGLQAAAASPAELALVLYAAAALGCEVGRQWLLSAALSAAHSVGRWGARDLSAGLWGLAHLGLRSVADGELLEVLLSRLTLTSAAAMADLGPHEQLQLLQAVALLCQPQGGGGGSSGTPAAAVAARRPLNKTALRRLRWAAHTAELRVQAAAAAASAAIAAAQRQQQQQQAEGAGSPAPEAAAAAAAAAVAALDVAAAEAACAAAASAAARTGRVLEGAALPADPAWLLAWCQASKLRLADWPPSVVASALSAFAALGVPPPLAWQRAVLAQALQRRRQLTLHDASAVSEALALLKSPLCSEWAAALRVVSTPSAAAEQEPEQPRRRGRSISRRARLAAHWPWLKGAGGGRGGRQVQHPQRLTGLALLQLQRQQRTVRLVAWWRRVQLHKQQWRREQQERLLQRQRHTFTVANAARAVWGAQQRRPPPGASLRQGDSPVGSLDASVPVVPAPCGPEPNGSLRLQGRRLEDWQVGGLKLAGPPVRHAMQGASSSGDSSDIGEDSSTGSSTGSWDASVDGGGSGGGGAVEALADQESSGGDGTAPAAADAGRDAASWQQRQQQPRQQQRRQQQQQQQQQGPSAADVVVYGADTAVVPAAWNGQGAAMPPPPPTATTVRGVPGGPSSPLPGAQPRQFLSWAAAD